MLCSISDSQSSRRSRKHSGAMHRNDKLILNPETEYSYQKWAHVNRNCIMRTIDKDKTRPNWVSRLWFWRSVEDFRLSLAKLLHSVHLRMSRYSYWAQMITDKGNRRRNHKRPIEQSHAHLWSKKIGWYHLVETYNRAGHLVSDL